MGGLAEAAGGGDKGASSESVWLCLVEYSWREEAAQRVHRSHREVTGRCRDEGAATLLLCRCSGMGDLRLD